jgi:precorrin-3B synthase
MVLLEGLREMPEHQGIIARADDPLLRISACTGAPACGAAHAETRGLAVALARHLPRHAQLHVSGCTKGCAHPRASEFTLVATTDGFHLVHNGTTRDAPVRRGLTRATILADSSAVLELP